MEGTSASPPGCVDVEELSNCTPTPGTEDEQTRSQLAKEKGALGRPSAAWDAECSAPDRKGENDDMPQGMTVEAYQALRDAFNMIDKDGSGFIDDKELMGLLAFRGIHATEHQVQDILAAYDVDDNGFISFDDFARVLGGTVGTNAGEVMREFVKESAGYMSQLADVGEPYYLQEERRQVRQSLQESLTDGSGSLRSLRAGRRRMTNARVACSKIVDGPWAQAVIFVLIVVDVVCVIMEFMLVATKCKDNPNIISEDRRRLVSSAPLNVQPLFLDEDLPRQLAASVQFSEVLVGPQFCQDCFLEQVFWETLLHWMSVSILWIFMCQILMLMCVYGLRFFRNFFFVLDAVVVGGALILELALHVSEGALLAVLLSWRAARVLHGLVTTIEINHKKTHQKIHKLVKQNPR
eukprot:gnl/TRDRNA2_/TRDRNA2_71257_c1_seq2.p1 gnl/TRDRNA2_/TRDRNA2_71257_c1~~gnl/TRDRNA2_/TRDRNA2_71257_c1_seq2.p1  ORF type:complete len:408 (+),score=60.08 gnl/TRDRNA2_/TRDRNA2_71257_c1_seq2:82-1305(+)